MLCSCLLEFGFWVYATLDMRFVYCYGWFMTYVFVGFAILLVLVLGCLGAWCFVWVWFVFVGGPVVSFVWVLCCGLWFVLGVLYFGLCLCGFGVSFGFGVLVCRVFGVFGCFLVCFLLVLSVLICVRGCLCCFVCCLVLCLF